MRFANFIASKLIGRKYQESSFIIRLSYFSIALGMSVIIIGTSLINGFQKEIADKIYTFLGHIEVSSYDAFSLSEGVPISYSKVLFDSLKNKSFKSINRQEIEVAKEKISHIQKIALTNVILQSKQDMDGMLLKGVDSDFNPKFWNRYLIEGVPLSIEKDTTSKSIVISKSTSERLNRKIGDGIIVNFVKNNKPYRSKMIVTGIFETEMPEYDIRYAFTDIKIIQQHFGWTTDQISKVEIFVEDTDDIDIITEGVYQDLPMGYFASSVKDNEYTIFSWLSSQNTLKIPIIGLMTLVCILNMMTMLLILILDRTTMIGILKALGANNADMRAVFIRYSGYIILKGMLLGNLIGIGLCWLQLKFGWLKLPAKDYYISTAAIDLDFGRILLLNLFFFSVIILTIIIPTYIINKVSPVKAIRWK